MTAGMDTPCLSADTAKVKVVSLPLTVPVTAEDLSARQAQPEQLDLFTDYAAKKEQEAALKREKNLQRAVLDIKNKYGKNAILKGMNYEEGATAAQRNRQIGGHKA